LFDQPSDSSQKGLHATTKTGRYNDGPAGRRGKDRQQRQSTKIREGRA
jgi:hypothetical protein